MIQLAKLSNDKAQLQSKQRELESILDTFNSQLPTPYPENTPSKSILLDGFIQLVEHGKKISSSNYDLELAKLSNNKAELQSSLKEIESAIAAFNSTLPSTYDDKSSPEVILIEGSDQLVEHTKEINVSKHKLELDRLTTEFINEKSLLHEEILKLKKEIKLVRSQSDDALKRFSKERSLLCSEISELKKQIETNVSISSTLHQAQEQLEDYLLRSKSLSELTKAQSQLLNRSQSLLCKLTQQTEFSLQSGNSVNVEVLPPDNTQIINKGSVETEALLHSYKTSIERATDLLKIGKLATTT